MEFTNVRSLDCAWKPVDDTVCAEQETKDESVPDSPGSPCNLIPKVFGVDDLRMGDPT
jgi:hypothetical protein